DALGIIASATSPVILAGRGAVGARESLIRLADVLGAALGTTLRGRELFAGHEADIGVVGYSAHSPALEAMQAADCVIAFGASLGRWTTTDGSLLGGKRVVQIDVDPRQL